MDENRLHDKLDQIAADISEIKVTHAADMGLINGTLAVNTKSLQDHMRRTEALEARVEQVSELATRAKGVWWFITSLAALSAAWLAVKGFI